ncbi:MAG: hypothetical protein Q8Q54_11845 [Methylococcales bacterium]|nr:hypothetical protein [Methylococcales bacterium]MDP3839603.1 hypothetical protein [Methylococcales bacterium]
MKKTLFLTIAMLISGGAFAGTEHYVLRDGNHVQHLKVTDKNGEVTISTDVDFEANANEKDRPACSASLTDEAKRVDKDNLLVKKHSEVDASFCELKINLTDTGAKIEQSKGCENFATGICHFSSDGKELVKVK